MQIVSTYIQTRFKPPAIWIPYKNRVRLFRNKLYVSTASVLDLQEWLSKPVLQINKMFKP